MDVTSQLIAFAQQVQTMLAMGQGKPGGVDSVNAFIQAQINGWNGTQAIINALQAQVNALTGGKPAVVVVPPPPLPNAVAGQFYNTQIGATGGTGQYADFSVTAGSLPKGLTLDHASGALYGTPNSVQSDAFTVTATDTGGMQGSQAYTLQVVAAPGQISISPAALPPAVHGSAYSQQLSATGGSGPYSFAVTAGSLPNSVTLTAAGLLSGTPPKAATDQFTVTATDSLGATGIQQYSWVIS